MILNYLPSKNLLFVQRVNKTWRDIISVQPSLQKKLFFKPDYNAQHHDNPMFAVFFSELHSDNTSLEGRSQIHMHMDNMVHRDVWTRKDASWRRMLTHQPPVTSLEFMPCSCHHLTWGQVSGIKCLGDGCRLQGNVISWPKGLQLGELLLTSVRLYISCKNFAGLEFANEHDRHCPMHGFPCPGLFYRRFDARTEFAEPFDRPQNVVVHTRGSFLLIAMKCHFSSNKLPTSGRMRMGDLAKLCAMRDKLSSMDNPSWTIC